MTQPDTRTVTGGEHRSPGLYVVFDGPPGHTSGRFIEVEDENGRSVGVGTWRQEGSVWALGPFPGDEALRAALATWHGGQLGRFGHRAGDHFDECVFCALLHGSGFAYPVEVQP